MLTLCKATAIVLHLGTLHFPQADNQNFNPGIGATCSLNSHVTIGAGYFRNSQTPRPSTEDNRSWSRQSFYGAIELHTPLFWGFEGGVVAGGATAYRLGAVAPIAGLVLHSPAVEGFRLNATFGPKTKNNSGLVHFTISKTF